MTTSRCSARPSASSWRSSPRRRTWGRSERTSCAATRSTATASSSRTSHLAFWTQLRQYLEDTGSPILTNRPSSDHWTNVSVGRSNFALSLFNNFKESRSGANLWLGGPDAKAHYRLIEQHHRPQVDAALTPLGEVRWREMPDAKESQIMVHRRVPPNDPATWPELNAWMANALRTMSDLFRPIVKDLDASAWAPEPGASLDADP